jgi:voltage-gated potassium channel
VLAATLALIPVLLLESSTSGTWQTVGFALNWAIWAVFAIELAAVLIYAPRKWAALRAHWLDVAIVVLTIPLFGRFLASLRLVRLARLLRLLRAGVILGRAIQSERALSSGDALRLAALLTIFLVVVAGAAEAAFDASEFPTIWDGIWWAVVTVTTVGYGDLYPRDVEGRIIGIIVMLAGIGFLSVLTATIASRFVKSDQDTDTKQLLAALNRIEQELADLKHQLSTRG